MDTRREVKFRAWDKITQTMCRVWDLYFKCGDNLNSITIEIDGTVERLPHEVELMQYTGLKDKHGKEIWEGNIIKWGVHTGEVAYKEGLWEFSGKGLVPCYRNCEVIGNIHENPELLES